jgi:hypothetical protein
VLAAKADMALKKTSTDGEVGVVIRTSSVPVCCASWTVCRNECTPISRNVKKPVPTSRNEKNSRPSGRKPGPTARER